MSRKEAGGFTPPAPPVEYFRKEEAKDYDSSAFISCTAPSRDWVAPALPVSRA